MSTDYSPPLAASDNKDTEKVALGESDVAPDNYSIRDGSDILALQDVDPALNAKMHLVNNVR